MNVLNVLNPKRLFNYSRVPFKKVWAILGKITVAVVTTLLEACPWSTSVACFFYRAFDIPAVGNVHGKKIFVSVNSARDLKRVRTYETKEPETIAWIDGFEPDSCYFDIGANIGVYTLYPAVKYGGNLQIFSFEPLSLNFAALNKNIHINNIEKKVTPYCLAVSESLAFSTLYVSNFHSGGSRSQFQNEDPLRPPVHFEGIIGISMDELCKKWQFPVPNYIKIDVDGIELSILKGAKEVLKNPQVKSILVELGEDNEVEEATKILNEAGLTLKEHSKRARGENNYIFARLT